MSVTSTISPAAASAGIAEHEDRSPWRSRRQAGPAFERRAGRQKRGIRNVLVVADASGLRKALARVLRQCGYSVLEASGAWQVEQLTEHERPIDLVLMDLSAPENADLQLALWLRALHPETRVLIAADSLWEFNLEFGASQQIALLAKPYTQSELRRVVRRLLD